MATFRLPDLGEGLTEAAVLRWLVGPGDVVVLNQPIVEVETAKAAVEVPSPYAGTVAELHHPVGADVEVGAPLITIDTGSGERTPVLVGYGPRTGGTPHRRARAGVAPAPVPTPASAPAAATATVAAPAPALVAPPASRRADGPLAKPLVRRLAKELGIDLTTVVPTGPHGTVSRADVQAATVPAGVPTATTAPAGDRLEPLTGLQRAMAQAMVTSVRTPHATLFITVDATPTMELVQRLRAVPELAGLRINPLLMVARALLLAVRRHPRVNSTWTDDGVLVHERVNLGFAAATPRGLLVPHIPDAGALSLAGLAGALGELTERARAGRTAPAEMIGGTITITNVGTFGVDTGTPILNPGESAILALGAIRPTPWVLDGEIVVRQVGQLALSFDHRVVDGQLGAQLLADIGRVLSDPDVALAWAV